MLPATYNICQQKWSAGRANWCRAWVGFARFCSVKYSNQTSDLDNQYIHLTNVAIQKHGEEYNDRHGGKWSLKNLVQWLEAVRGREATTRMVEQIEAIIINSCKSVQHVIINDKHCFELYG